jgi:papain like protease
MATSILFNRKFDARPDRIDFRDLPYRPRLVSLPEQYPSPADITRYFSSYRDAGMVLNQGQEGSCTGFGLAAVINYLVWERGLIAQNGPDRTPAKSPDRISARMLYQNARLYDEWKGEDYEGSSCRGAMKGLHKHGVCSERFWPNFGKAQPGWDENAPLTPLGAYFRIDSKSLIDMQSAIFETHAIYVSADAHDGWDRIKKCNSLDEAVIEPPRKSDIGGHAFAIVGYTCDGFVIQNSWSPDWGYHGFALLPYEDWTRHGSDAWALALGAPMRVTLKSMKGKKAQRKFLSPSARTEISLDERLRVSGALHADLAGDDSAASPWISGEEADHVIYIGHNGYAERELVAANDGDDAVRHVVEKAIGSAAAKGIADVAIYCHGGLNSRTDGIKRAQILGPWLIANDIWPVFVVWQSGFFESTNDLIKIGMERLGVPTEKVEGWVIDKLNSVKDRTFETFARDVGIKPIWENMKSRAAGASIADGGLMTAAASLRTALDAQKPAKRPNLHLLGHSAGAIMLGYFLHTMALKNLAASTIHLWAPACTVPFATATYGPAFANGVADAKKTFIGTLSDANEKSDACVPVLYSKSLLYLVSRALEPDHKVPILGLNKIWSQDDDTFMKDYEKQIDAWRKASKGVVFDDPIVKTEVPIRHEKDKDETIDANHGSFDNNLDVVNQAIARIVGKKPSTPVTDLRGF